MDAGRYLIASRMVKVWNGIANVPFVNSPDDAPGGAQNEENGRSFDGLGKSAEDRDEGSAPLISRPGLGLGMGYTGDFAAWQAGSRPVPPASHA